MDSKGIPEDATIESIRDKLDDPEKFARVVIGTMRPCLKEHGNASVRIGITGEGKAPYHKVVYDDEAGDEQLCGSFAGKVKDETYEVHDNTWSTTKMSYEEVENLIGSITGYRSPKAS